MKYVCELSESVQNEIRNDAIARLTSDTDYTMDEIIDIVDNIVMNEKLVNIDGYERYL